MKDKGRLTVLQHFKPPVKEAIHLRSLYRSSSNTLPKPYQSGSLYLPPVLLAALDPLLGGITSSALHLRSSLLWSACDVIAGLVLADIFSRKRKYVNRTPGPASSKGNARLEVDLAMGHILGSRGGIAGIYLLNPYTIASCLARSTTSISNLAVLVAIDSAMMGE
jgi:phosphatidylinositol glycan class U